MASTEVEANGSPVGLAAKPSMAYLKMKGTCAAHPFFGLTETSRGCHPEDCWTRERRCQEEIALRWIQQFHCHAQRGVQAR